MKQRSVGLLIAFVGTLVVTPDAALLRVQAEAGASPAVITVWRYAMSFFLGTAAAIIAHGGVSPVIESIRPAPLHVVGASCIMLGTNVGFTISLLKVDAAKALLLISLNPLWSALLGYFILGDKLPVRTVVAQVVALVAMLVMFAPNVLALLSPRSESPRAAEAEVQSAADQGNSELFDLIPLVTGMAQAALLIFVRSASIRIPECTMDFVPALSALFTVAFAVAKIAFVDGNADGSPWSLSSLVAGLHPHFWLALLGCGLGVAGFGAGRDSGVHADEINDSRIVHQLDEAKDAFRLMHGADCDRHVPRIELLRLVATDVLNRVEARPPCSALPKSL